MLSLALFIEDPLIHSVRSSFERKKKTTRTWSQFHATREALLSNPLVVS